MTATTAGPATVPGSAPAAVSSAPPPRVSVVVLTYDSAATLERCLTSIAAQDVSPYEVLIVDDDSTDATLEIAAEFARTRGLVLRTVRNGAHNISRGRNLGIAAAGGDVVAFLDSDAAAGPGWVRGWREAFADPAVVVAGGEVELVHTSDFARAVALNDETVRELFTRGALLISGCSMAVRRSTGLEHPFDEEFVHAEDVEFTHRVSVGEHRSAYVDSALVHHESRPTARGYFSQMRRYGRWKVHYSVATGDWRAIDLVPALVLVAGAAGALRTRWALLAMPAFCAAETAFVLVHRRAPLSRAPRSWAGWMVKNVGWGLGTLSGLAREAAAAGGAR